MDTISFGPFAVDDVPAGDLAWIVDTDDDLSAYETATARITDPLGVEVDAPDATLTQDGEDWIVTVSGFGTMDTPGRLDITVTLVGDTTHRTLPSVAFIVEEPTQWHTLASARAEWENGLTDVQLWTVLQVAREQVAAFAPEFDEADDVPVRYRQAQLMQARNITNAARVSPAGDLGADSFVVSPRPLDWTVKATIRPQRGRPLVG